MINEARGDAADSGPSTPLTAPPNQELNGK
jgi:hypothetical protein